MIDDTMGEAIRAGERPRIRAQVVALRIPNADCTRMPRCEHCYHNEAIGEVLAVIDHPATEIRT